MHYTLAVVLMTLATPGWGLTKYVKENGRSTGISWQLATGDLQAAIDEVADAVKVKFGSLWHISHSK